MVSLYVGTLSLSFTLQYGLVQYNGESKNAHRLKELMRIVGSFEGRG
jgi:hypothetical protein